MMTDRAGRGAAVGYRADAGLRGSAAEVRMAAAFKDVTDDDWARLPDDLTGRPDDHLSGRADR